MQQRPVRTAARLSALIALAACTRAEAPPPVPAPGPDGLAVELDRTLHAIAAADHPDDTARAAVASWRFPEATWGALVTEAYRPHWRDYAAAFEAALPAVAARLAALRGAVRARWQYAGDPQLSNAQVRLRWVMPTGRPGVVAEIGGVPLDVVFVWDGAAWRALDGVDDVVQAAVGAHSAPCRAALVAAGPPGICTDVAWMIADAALRGQAARLDRGCAIAAANRCGAAP